MIIRIILVLFISGASGICYLAGFVRLMSGLLIGFSSLISLFFALLFLLPAESSDLWFPVHGEGAAWPFLLLAVLQGVFVAFLLTQRRELIEGEPVSSDHFQYLVGASLAYLLNIFLSSFFLFPSEQKRLSADESTLGMYVLIGICIYLLGTIISLYLFYKSSKGTAPHHPDLMRRLILALFSVFHFDKFPAFIAFLLIYSPETRIIYPWAAALALSAHIPIAYFLLKISWQCERKIG